MKRPLGASSQVYLIKLVNLESISDIKANDSDGPVSITPQEPVEITISLIPNNQRDVNMDWWIGAFAPFGTYWYAPSQRWVKSNKPISFGQIPLYELQRSCVAV